MNEANFETQKANVGARRKDLKGRSVYVPALDAHGTVHEQNHLGQITAVRIDGKIINVIDEIVELVPTIWELVKTILRKLNINI